MQLEPVICTSDTQISIEETDSLRIKFESQAISHTLDIQQFEFKGFALIREDGSGKLDETLIDNLISSVELESMVVSESRTYLPGQNISFGVNCNQYDGWVPNGGTYFLSTDDGAGTVQNAMDMVFLKQGVTNHGMHIDAVNVGTDIIKLTAVSYCIRIVTES